MFLPANGWLRLTRTLQRPRPRLPATRHRHQRLPERRGGERDANGVGDGGQNELGP